MREVPEAALAVEVGAGGVPATDLDAAAARAPAARWSKLEWAWLKVVPVMLMLLLSAVAGAAGGVVTAMMGKVGETRVCGGVALMAWKGRAAE